ncbi:MAG: bifunctional 4-hydroxy-2-oxoglutarate aldolase/2-dehydro-3-deoxy-phosphogluconate aldolase [Candidatus Sericytochromatia bacterium]|nr:bifunctional 4-hydroxy-2-oxoglutarate aldolase/2-dehydro-3-deoxy-phosphogluconate aldolase [Candidatus Sericytochromatia bacterium]
MVSDDFLKALGQQQILPILRLDNARRCLKLAQTLFECGFKVLEITLDTPEAPRLIRQLNAMGAITGAGTLKHLADADRALAAGAQFLVSPGLSLEIARRAQHAQTPYFPGVWTPTEVLLALSHGIQTLKLFPASIGGPAHLKHLRGPFPEIQWLPTGGIGLNEVPAYLQAGALAVGQGTRLVSAAALQAEDWGQIQAELQGIHTHLGSSRS